MKVNDFIFICEEYSVCPQLASEDEGVKAVLKTPTSDHHQQIMLKNYLKNYF